MRVLEHKRLSHLLLLLVFGACTFIPLGAYLVGIRGDTAWRNQTRLERPSIDVGLLLDTEKTTSFDAYFLEALPFREDLVRADARVDMALRDSPNPAVVLGNDGWRFLTASLDTPCLSDADVRSFTATVERADRVVASTDRTLVVVVGPDKASVYPDRLGEQASCLVSNAEALEDALPAGHVAGWSELVAARDQSHIYFDKDTHWTPTGARLIAGLVVDAAVDGVWQGTGRVALSTGAACTGDLGRMAGDPTVENFMSFERVTPGGSDRGCFSPLVPSAIADPLGPRAHMAHDSFGHTLAPFLEPYFSSFTKAANPTLLGTASPELLASSDVIIWQTVQRSALRRVVTLDLASELVVALRDELPLRSAAVAWDGGQATISLEAVDVEQYVLVALASGSAEAKVVINGRERTLNQASPVVSFFATEQAASFELRSGVVTVQLAHIAG